jgi:hypothetical protein
VCLDQGFGRCVLGVFELRGLCAAEHKSFSSGFPTLDFNIITASKIVVYVMDFTLFS